MVEQTGYRVRSVICPREVVYDPKLDVGLGLRDVSRESEGSSHSWRMGLVLSIDSWMNRMTVYGISLT